MNKQTSKQTTSVSKILSVLLLSVPFFYSSCKDNFEEQSSTKGTEAVLEISQEKENYEFIESVYNNGNSEFTQGEFVQSIRRKSDILTESSGNDTIKCSDDIPEFTSESINQVVFADGTYRYESLNTTPPDSIYINTLNPSVLANQDEIAKTVIVNGVVSLFNADGTVLHTEPDDTNFSSVLDSIKAAVATSEVQNKSTMAKKNKYGNKASRNVWNALANSNG
jgi:hypothetical protein